MDVAHTSVTGEPEGGMECADSSPDRAGILRRGHEKAGIMAGARRAGGERVRMGRNGVKVFTLNDLRFAAASSLRHQRFLRLRDGRC